MMKVTTGVGFTAQVPPLSVDSYMAIVWGNAVLEKSSKKMCGTPWLSTTKSENCSWVKAPLTRAGCEKGRPAPGECDSRITEEPAGMMALPSLQPVELKQKYV